MTLADVLDRIVADTAEYLHELTAMTNGELADTVLGTLRRNEDPEIRLAQLGKVQSIYKDLVERLGVERARAMAEMHARGQSYGQIAAVTGLSRGRVQQLVEDGRREHG